MPAASEPSQPALAFLSQKGQEACHGWRRDLGWELFESMLDGQASLEQCAICVPDIANMFRWHLGTTQPDAIESGDEKMLTTLPAVGKRMAQLIVAELQGKLGDFALSERQMAAGHVPFGSFQTEALEILIAWGEKRHEAMELIELTCQKHPDIQTAEDLVPLAYRIKQGIEA